MITQVPLVAQMVKNLQESQVRSLGQEDPLGKEITTHSSILAWRIPWTEETQAIGQGVARSRTRLSDHHTPWWHANTIFFYEPETPALLNSYHSIKFLVLFWLDAELYLILDYCYHILSYPFLPDLCYKE